jgi:hypothetical protein
MYAAARGSEAVVHWLLQKGVRPDHRDKGRRTATFYCVTSADDDRLGGIIRCLVEGYKGRRPLLDMRDHGEKCISCRD